MSTPELIFVVIGGVGLALLLVSLLFGEFEFGAEAEGGTDANSGGMPAIFSFSVIATALVGIGTVGFITLWLGIPLVAAVICSLGGAVVLAVLMLYCILRPLAKQQHTSMIGRDSYGGLEASVTLSVPQGEGFGEVRFTDPNGALVTERARSHLGNTIPQGARVVIVYVASDGVRVAPLDTNL